MLAAEQEADSVPIAALATHQVQRAASVSSAASRRPRHRFVVFYEALVTAGFYVIDPGVHIPASDFVDRVDQLRIGGHFGPFRGCAPFSGTRFRQ